MQVLSILFMGQQRFPLNFILLNLAVSDLCMASIGASMSARAALNHGWHYSATTCQAYALVMSVTGKSERSFMIIIFNFFLLNTAGMKNLYTFLFQISFESLQTNHT